jgi:hypothetical protein
MGDEDVWYLVAGGGYERPGAHGGPLRNRASAHAKENLDEVANRLVLAASLGFKVASACAYAEATAMRKSCKIEEEQIEDDACAGLNPGIKAEVRRLHSHSLPCLSHRHLKQRCLGPNLTSSLLFYGTVLAGEAFQIAA